MSSSTISTASERARAPGARRRAGRPRLSQRLLRALTPSAEGPVRGRTLEALRRALEMRLDAARLRERMPDVAEHLQRRERIWATLLPAYRRYVARVAPPAESMSLEVAGLLVDLCEWSRPRRILEIGTSFGSVALRRLTPTPPWQPEIWSADDDPARLARTRSFLAEESLSTERLLSWRELQGLQPSGYELVVHELASTPSVPLTAVLGQVAAGGVLLLDGAHRPGSDRSARQLLAEANVEHWSLRALTRDCFGRHALLALR